MVRVSSATRRSTSDTTSSNSSYSVNNVHNGKVDREIRNYNIIYYIILFIFIIILFILIHMYAINIAEKDFYKKHFNFVPKWNSLY